MTIDLDALIAHARTMKDSVIVRGAPNTSASLINALADALEQSQAELRQEREQAEAKPKQNDPNDFANTPTADERGYDSDMAVMLSQLVEDEPMWSCVVIAKELHAAGFRRTVAPEPSADWDRVHDRPADIYTPPEDRIVRPSPEPQAEPTDAAEGTGQPTNQTATGSPSGGPEPLEGTE